MKTMDASRVRSEFAGVLDGVRDRGEAVVIVRYGRPLAAVVPLARLSPRELRDLNQPSNSHSAAVDRRPSRAR